MRFIVVEEFEEDGLGMYYSDLFSIVFSNMVG